MDVKCPEKGILFQSIYCFLLPTPATESLHAPLLKPPCQLSAWSLSMEEVGGDLKLGGRKVPFSPFCWPTPSSSISTSPERNSRGPWAPVSTASVGGQPPGWVQPSSISVVPTPANAAAAPPLTRSSGQGGCSLRSLSSFRSWIW